MYLEYFCMSRRGKYHEGIDWDSQWKRALNSPRYHGAKQFKPGVPLHLACTYMYKHEDMPSVGLNEMYQGTQDDPVEHIPEGMFDVKQIFGATLQVVEGPENRVEVEIYPIESRLL